MGNYRRRRRCPSQSERSRKSRLVQVTPLQAKLPPLQAVNDVAANSGVAGILCSAQNAPPADRRDRAPAPRVDRIFHRE